MNIHFSLFYQHSISIFKENVQPSLTVQQKKILVIASLVFGVIAVCFIIKRCCFKASIEKDEQSQSFPPFANNDQNQSEFQEEKLKVQNKRAFGDDETFEQEIKDSILNDQDKKPVGTLVLKANS